MIRSITFACIAFIAFSCSNDYNPSSHLDAKEQDATMNKIIRYMAKAPEGLTMQERFYAAYDSYYQEQKSLHRLDAYFIKDGVNYFLVSRPAPSLTEKRVSTGGRMKFNDAGELTEYEEVFRTWKMPDTVLIKKSLMLFDKMVKDESLEPYLTKNSMPEEYIEFPDEHTYFDKTARSWKQK